MIASRLSIALLLTLLPTVVLSFPRPRDPGPPRTYVCEKTDTAPLIDGRLDEPAWDQAVWTTDFLDIQGAPLDTPRHRTRAKMCWDDNYFYMAAVLDEPHVWGALTDRDAVIYHDNDFEVFIDPDGDNHLYYELEINALGTEWDLLLIKPYRDGSPAVNAWDIQGLQTAVHIDGTVNDPTDQDQGWSVEIAMPWQVLQEAAGRNTPPADGDIWRVNFSRVQWQTRQQDGRYIKLDAPEDNWVWSPQGLIAMHYPENWGEVMFVEKAGDGTDLWAASAEHEAIGIARSLMEIYYAQKQYHADHGRFAGSLAQLEHGFTMSADTWRLSMTATDQRFLITLTTPDLTVTVNEEGRLRRRVPEAKP